MSFNLGNMWSKSKKNNGIKKEKNKYNKSKGMLKIQNNKLLVKKSSGKI